MPQYAVLIYTNDSAHAPAATREDFAEPDAHSDELAASGALVAAWAFTPRSLAKSIRAEGITAGPFVDTDAVIAGVYILDAHDETAALAIAATNPVVRDGSGVEVRPIHSGGDTSPPNRV